MKKTFLKIIGGATAAILLTAVFAQIWVSAQEEAEKTPTENSYAEFFASGIEGAWQTVVTRRNCQTGAAIAPPFPGLLTFHHGGTVSELSSGTSPVLRSPGQGVWERENGPHRYQMAFNFFRFDASGAFIGSQRVRQTVELIGERGAEFVTSGTGFTSSRNFGSTPRG